MKVATEVGIKNVRELSNSELVNRLEKYRRASRDIRMKGGVDPDKLYAFVTSIAESCYHVAVNHHRQPEIGQLKQKIIDISNAIPCTPPSDVKEYRWIMRNYINPGFRPDPDQRKRGMRMINKNPEFKKFQECMTRVRRDGHKAGAVSHLVEMAQSVTNELLEQAYINVLERMGATPSDPSTWAAPSAQSDWAAPSAQSDWAARSDQNQEARSARAARLTQEEARAAVRRSRHQVQTVDSIRQFQEPVRKLRRTDPTRRPNGN